MQSYNGGDKGKPRALCELVRPHRLHVRMGTEALRLIPFIVFLIYLHGPHVGLLGTLARAEGHPQKQDNKKE